MRFKYFALTAFAATAAVSTSASAVTIGGYNVVASATSLDASSGTFTTVGGSLATVLTDGDVGTYAYSFSRGASVTLGFSTPIGNGAGNDFVLFELGTPDTFTVTINNVTLSGLATNTGASAGGFNLNAVAFDLSSFGLAAGATVSSLLIGMDTPNNANGTVPSLSLAGVLNAGRVGPSVPEPATWAMMVAGFGLVGGALRGRRNTAVTFG